MLFMKLWFWLYTKQDAQECKQSKKQLIQMFESIKFSLLFGVMVEQNWSWVNIPEKYAIANIWVAWVSSAKGHLSRDRSGQLRCTAVQLEVVRRPVAELVGATGTCTRAQFLAFQKLSSFRQQLRCCKNCFPSMLNSCAADVQSTADSGAEREWRERRHEKVTVCDPSLLLVRA